MIGNAKLVLIVVMSENRVIARQGSIPWHIPEDQKRYRSLIRNHIAILGRKTMDDSYTETENIVVTMQTDYVPPLLAHVVHSVPEALEIAKDLLNSSSSEEQRNESRSSRFAPLTRTIIPDEVFVLGGGEIFHETIGLADKLYLTIVHEETKGDTYFPDYSAFTKVVEKRESESNGYKITFLDLEKS